MGGEALVKLVLLRVRRASRDLLCIVGFGAEFLRTGLHVLHGPFTSAASSQGMKAIHLCELPSQPDGPFLEDHLAPGLEVWSRLPVSAFRLPSIADLEKSECS